ncbi:MAG: type I DNA topoisomerase [Candidatus Kapaibacteriales bacterium]
MAEIKEEYRKKKSLVIVESPAKAKTIEKYLGKGFEVKSSIGHIRDLKKSEMSIDLENGFEPQYEISRGKGKTVTELKRLAKAADIIWLATDEDREGEAIAWHLYEALKLKPENTKRITFAEITKAALIRAINNPREIDKDLVDAQQARRILDRIVGYELSPVLWKKVRYGLSAGRVQSVAVRLIVEREREIEAFETEPSFKVTGEFQVDADNTLKTNRKDKLVSLEDTRQYFDTIKGKKFSVKSLEKKPGTRRPGAPFTTSKLQQEASAKLGYSVKQTMTLAQKLYENGLITYMRTDSTNLSDDARKAAGSWIKNNLGSEYHEERNYKSKSSNAQEAHEAIRPTDFAREAANLGDSSLDSLYNLIRRKALASQMSPAKVEKTVVTIQAEGTDETLQATAEIIVFPGFLAVMGMKDDGEQLLPDLKEGQELDLNVITATETFTRPPARYTEATLVRTLEEKGIGRPSTYSPTISTIQDRGYVIKEDRPGKEREFKVLSMGSDWNLNEGNETEIYGAEKSKLFPTDTGGVVTDFLVQYFEDIVDYNFTANVEETFDEIANGKKAWQSTIADFYKDFHPKIEDSDKISKQETLKQRLLGEDPKTGKPVFARFGRFGPMIMLGDNEKEEEVKFASIPKSLNIDTIKLDDALPLLELPRTVGETPEGKKIKANRGRFGPYVQLDKTYVSIQEEEIYTITYEEALGRIRAKEEEKRKALIHDFSNGLRVLNGRFGPYITNGKKNVKIPKGVTPDELTEDETMKIFKEAPQRKGRGRATSKKK